MFNRLLSLLPPLADDSIEALIARDGAALAHLDALGPIRSAEEASLAVTVVATDTHAHDALRLAGLNADNLKTVMQCRSQAMMMLRTRGKAVDRLERLQREYANEALLTGMASALGAATAEAPTQAHGPADEPSDARLPAPLTGASLTTSQDVRQVTALQASEATSAPASEPTPELTPEEASGSTAERVQPVAATQPPAMSPEERDRRRVEVTASYARLAGHGASPAANNTDGDVSIVTPDLAVIATRHAPLLWQPLI